MSLISELKREVLIPDIAVSTLLRKALIASKELRDEENERWISRELKGYSDNDDLPNYRDIQGSAIVRDHYTGWQYVYTQNLSPEMIRKISSFKFRSPLAELESNAKEEELAITYETKTEQMMIRALGGKPSIPAVRFTGTQFQTIVDTVRDRLTEWLAEIPEPEEPQPAAVAAAQPRYITRLLGENKSWVFQGIGTEIVKWVGGILLLLITFIIGYYWPRDKAIQPVTTSPTPTVAPIGVASPTP